MILRKSPTDVNNIKIELLSADLAWTLVADHLRDNSSEVRPAPYRNSIATNFPPGNTLANFIICVRSVSTRAWKEFATHSRDICFEAHGEGCGHQFFTKRESNAASTIGAA